jgi:ERCC4-type nuclease
MLVIDSRERKGSLLVDLVEKKAKSMNIKTEKRWLEIGDYVFDDVCFEAKSDGDLTEGIKNIMENSQSKLPAASRAVMLNNKFLGGLGRITLDTDCKAFWVPTEKEAALIISAICKMKPIEREVIRPEVFKRITTDDLRLDLLTSIKGVSIKKAKELIKEFGSIMEIGEQRPHELTVIDGIGTTVAERIVKVLNHEGKVKI